MLRARRWPHIAASRRERPDASSADLSIIRHGAPFTNEPKITFAGNAESDCVGITPTKTPSDQALAIGDGASPILQVNNDCVSVWSPGGTRLLGPKTLQAFAGLAASEAVYDPRAIYDW